MAIKKTIDIWGLKKHSWTSNIKSLNILKYVKLNRFDKGPIETVTKINAFLLVNGSTKILKNVSKVLLFLWKYLLHQDALEYSVTFKCRNKKKNLRNILT